MTVKSHARWKGKKKNKLLCKTCPIVPGLCARNRWGFATEVSGKLGRRTDSVWTGCYGGGQQSEKDGPE